MIYIQDILQAAVTRIVTGSTVANVTGTGPYTFTTAALKNMAVGQKIKIGIELYTVTNIAGLTVTITGNVKPDPGTWVLPLNFRYGHRLEIDNILQNEAQNPANQGTQYPFLWLILNYPQRQIPELRDVVAYETDINLVLVTDTSKDYVATERLTNKFKTVFDYYFELLTAELNTSPILEYFQNDEILCTFTDRYFYGSFDKGQNVFNASYTDAREMEFAGLRVYKSICVPTPMLKNPATFAVTLAGDPEAIVGTPYAFTLEIERTDTHPEANNIFSIVVAFGDGATQTIGGGLAIGQSVIYNLSHTYDIAGAITISVTGSATDSLGIEVLTNYELALVIDTSISQYTNIDLSAFSAIFDMGDNTTPQVRNAPFFYDYGGNVGLKTIQITAINAGAFASFGYSSIPNIKKVYIYNQSGYQVTIFGQNAPEFDIRNSTLDTLGINNINPFIAPNGLRIKAGGRLSVWDSVQTAGQVDTQWQKFLEWVTANDITGIILDTSNSPSNPTATGLSYIADIIALGNTVNY